VIASGYRASFSGPFPIPQRARRSSAERGCEAEWKIKEVCFHLSPEARSFPRLASSERAVSFGKIDGLVAFQGFAPNPTGFWESLIQSKFDESHEIVDESHGPPVSDDQKSIINSCPLLRSKSERQAVLDRVATRKISPTTAP
jgi:hypothetical protein